MKKQTYSQPQAEIFELQLSGSVLQSASPTSTPNDVNDGYDDDNDLGTI